MAGCPYTVHLFLHTYTNDNRFSQDGNHSDYASYLSVNATLGYYKGYVNLDNEQVLFQDTVKANVFEYLPLTALRNNYKDTYNISISRFPGHPPIPSIYYMWHSQLRSEELRQKHIAASGIDYKWTFRMRHDAVYYTNWWQRAFNIQVYNSSNPIHQLMKEDVASDWGIRPTLLYDMIYEPRLRVDNILYVPFGWSYGGYNDQFAAMSSMNAKHYFTRILHIRRMLNEEKVHPETSIRLVARWNNITVNNVDGTICYEILPNLQILIVQGFSGLEILEVAEKPADSKPLLSLTSLSLLSINMTDIEELKSLLSLVPNLTYFRINAMSELTDSFYDGTQWEEIIRAKLPLLDHFKFCFEHCLSEKPESNIVEEHIAKFQTPFWLETKSLLVRCALESETNGHSWKLYLHSIPISEDYIEYYSDGKQIINSAVNKIDHDLELFINIRQLRLFIGQIPDTITSEGTRSCQRYLFPCVGKLTLVINEKWPIGTIQYLQNTVNLTNLETLQFEFSSTCQFETNLDADMHTLFEHTLNLRSLIINGNQSEQMNLTTYNSICLKLPQSVKYLSAHITHVEDAQRLLEKVNNLSRVTFQMIPCESSFMDDIKERLLQAGIYVRLEMERDDICSWIERDEPDEVHCYPVHLWLEKRYQDIID
ncbi:unnamed protein product [Rotaria magnacalcarata]|uniref:Uncharacterized protein n=2 Tax=Rotaria magnacalcarata TaxID=392030 RepID=A0A816B0Q4_9BILA|nr:unnamed protein product [Rotaria magnacalcarata]